MQVGDSVQVLAKVYDRLAPILYSCEKGDIGKIIHISFAEELRETLVTVEFGMCIVVVNERMLVLL